MIGLLCFALAILASPFKSKLRLEAENAMLRHQLIVLKRRLHGRVRLTNRISARHVPRFRTRRPTTPPKNDVPSWNGYSAANRGLSPSG